MSRRAILFIAALLLYGKLHAGVDFSVANSSIAFANTTALDFTTSNFSISFWASGMDSVNNIVVINRSQYITAGYSVFFLSGQFWLTTERPGSQVYIVMAPTVTPGWHHYCAVRTGTTGTWYIDGSAVVTSGSCQNPSSYSGDLQLGSYLNANYFRGKLDDVAIYNRNLSAIEIKNIALSYQRNKNTDGRVFYAPLNEGPNLQSMSAAGAGAIKDRSPNYYTGTATNNARWDYSSPLNYP